MPYLLLKGEFHIHYPDDPRHGPEPDGDTLKFKPHRPDLADRLRRAGQPRPGFNKRGMINLRFEGIDALETHFKGAHQNLVQANAARDFLLRQAGFGEVRFFPDRPNKVEFAEHHPVPGYVLSNGLDGHGRIVSFVFFGDCAEPDGAQLFLDAARMETSGNAALLRAGQAYPLFYFTLPVSLREPLKSIADQAAAAGAGLWPQDASAPNHAFQAGSKAALEALVIWPKLFRRLVSYFDGGAADLTGFDAWLRADPVDRDDRMITPDNHDARFHNVLEVVSATSLRLKYASGDLTILPDDFQLPAPAIRG